MSRLRRRTDGDVDEFDAFQDGDIDIEFLADTAGAGKQKRAAKGKAAWQRVDERREIRLLREQLEDWDDWDENWSGETPEARPPN